MAAFPGHTRAETAQNGDDASSSLLPAMPASSPLLPRLRGFSLALALGGALLIPAASGQRLLVYQSFDDETLYRNKDGSEVYEADGVGGYLENFDSTEFPAFVPAGARGGALDFTAGRLDTIDFAGGSTALGDHFTIAFWMRTADVEQVSQSYVLQVGGPSNWRTAAASRWSSRFRPPVRRYLSKGRALSSRPAGAPRSGSRSPPPASACASGSSGCKVFFMIGRSR